MLCGGVFWKLVVASNRTDQRMKIIMEDREKHMEVMRDINRVMEREIEKGGTPLVLEKLGGDYSYHEIISGEKLLQVLSYLLRIG